MGADANETYLNLGCGSKKILGKQWINVDAYDTCEPDFIWDLNKTPYPWETGSIDKIYMSHTLEHLPNWWEAFKECSRILKVGGELEIRVPDESSCTALTYRDHVQAFSLVSFHGIQGAQAGTNAWAMTVKDSIPLNLERWHRVPFTKYAWMIRWAPWLLNFCADHLRNYIHEQVFIFRKVGDRNV
jgi:SAM-dependent methyltransferase